MDQILGGGIITSLAEGKFNETMKFIAIFVLLWFEMRGLKKEFKTLNATVASGFKAGEDRFSKIESKQQEFEHRLTVREQKQQGVTP